jgi:hypothetical protein
MDISLSKHDANVAERQEEIRPRVEKTGQSRLVQETQENVKKPENICDLFPIGVVIGSTGI